jgi:hypothetical protein
LLAYVFWHAPADGVAREDYEERLRAFHATLAAPSAAFRLDDGGYEDWYLVDDWAALGALNEAAVAAARRAEHDAAAALSGQGAGGVYALVRGAAVPPAAVRWEDRLTPDVEADAIWQRQMVLGPRPEFCLAGAGGTSRERVA